MKIEPFSDRGVNKKQWVLAQSRHLRMYIRVLWTELTKLKWMNLLNGVKQHDIQKKGNHTEISWQNNACNITYSQLIFNELLRKLNSLVWASETKQNRPLTLLLTCLDTTLTVSWLWVTACCECKTSSTMDKMGKESWDRWAPRGTPPALATLQVLYD